MELVLITVVANFLALMNLRLLGIKQGLAILMIIFNIAGFFLYLINYEFSIKLLITNTVFVIFYIVYLLLKKKSENTD